MQLIPDLNSLTNLNKLRLLLLTPMIALLFFAGTALIGDFRLWRNAILSQNLLTLSSELSYLAYQLQQERGLGIINIGVNDTDLPVSLSLHRRAVDRLISKFQHARQRWTNGISDSLANELGNVSAALSAIDETRATIDTQPENDALTYYSELIGTMLELILQLQLESENRTFSESARSHNALLWIQENAALERDTVSLFFSGHSMANRPPSDINAYITAQKSYRTKFDFMAQARYRDLLNRGLNKTVTDDLLPLRGTVLDKTEKTLALNELRNLIGYGGLIHHFKNFILRGDPEHAIRVRQLFAATLAAIEKYRVVPDISATENHLLQVIESTLQGYRDSLITIERMRRQGHSISEIDNAIHIKDSFALTALDELTRQSGLFDLSAWWQKASARITLLHEASSTIEDDLKRQSKHDVATANRNLLIVLTLTLGVFLITLLLGKRLKQRLVDDIVNIAGNMRALAKKDSEQRQLSLQGADEIADMSRAFNDLLSTLKQTEQKLSESEQNYRLISTLLPQQIWTARPDGSLDFVNQRVLEYFAVAEEQLLDHGWQQLIHPEDLSGCLESWHKSLSTACAYETEYRLRHHDGHYRWHLARALPQFDELGHIVKWFGSNTDISEHKRTREKLNLAAKVFDHAHEAIMITDAEPKIIDVNPVFTDITGYSADEAIGKNPNFLASEKQSAQFYDDLWQSLQENGYWKGEVWNLKKNGKLYAELLTISTVYDADGKVQNYISLFSDITQTKYQQRALEQMAHFDMLTQLPNRTLFSDRFHQAIARSKRDKSLLAVVFLDLDGFKPINDRHGHEAGDQVLIEVAKRIIQTIREEDTASRLGGDEFALLLTHIQSHEQSKKILSRIHQAIMRPYSIAGHFVTLSASSGITLYPWDDGDPDTLLRHADHAMYQAKMEGKNRYHFFDTGTVHQQAFNHQQLQDIEKAFELEQFCLYYQPKVDIQNGCVIGAEALLRWRHPKQGLIQPGDFLPVIEGSRLDNRLGRWVIETAVEQLDQWRRQELNLEISVNISSQHLLATDFVTQVQEILQHYPEVPPHCLQLEILENSALGDLKLVNKIIQTLSETLNVKIALDDFGTGYSSLTHLRHLSVDMVKIDQGFVRNMLDDPNDYTIIEGVISLSQALHREVIAEGVETSEHGLLLLMLGCHLAQGYGIARPMPAAEIPAWVTGYHTPEPWRQMAHRTLTEQQAAIELLRLVDKRWLMRMQTCLQSLNNNLPNWPIMNYHMSHCGRWLKLAQANGIISQDCLQQLQELHKKLHHVGNTLMNHFLEGDIQQAQDGIVELEDIFDSIEKLLHDPDHMTKSH